MCLLATPRGVAVLPRQLSLLRGLAASVCLVWGKAEPTIRPSRTILHDALNEQAMCCSPPHHLLTRARKHTYAAPQSV